MSEQQNNCYNGEHYRDQTARVAIQRAEPNSDIRLRQAVHSARAVFRVYDFDVVDRIVLPDRKNGRIYR